MPTPLPPGSILGIMGGGQLGRMTVMAAAQLGYHVHIYCPEADSPAAEVARFSTVAEYTDRAALERFADAVNAITFEFENIPADCLRLLEAHTRVHPSAELLHISQNRLREKTFAHKHGIPTAPFARVGTLEELTAALKQIGTPAILKTAELGYDGKGQALIRTQSEAATAWEKVKGVECILEGFVPFTMEISVIAARDAVGNIACYPPVQNIHRDHILHKTIAPAPLPPELAAAAESIARRLAEASGLVGLLAVEMFVTKDGLILMNELAPRPHNSGHWTLDACMTSQFEQLVRAVCGLPLGSVEMLCPAEMVNLIGGEVQEAAKYLTDPSARLHLYGKKDPRPGRKMGHVTFLRRSSEFPKITSTKN